MTTNVKIYRSTDPGAAALTIYGNVPASTYGAGGWIGVLKACLVDGYGSKTASSLVVAGAIATFTSTAHGFTVGQCLLVAGSTPSSLNGEKYVASVTANTFTFDATGIGDQTATGTITAKVAPAGWTEPYSPATNITAFKQGGGNGFYLNIDETAVQVSRVTGFESMTAVGIANGTNAFPTTSQLSGGLYWNRSSVSSTTARDWIIVATDRHLYIHINGAGTALAADAAIMGMVDLKAYKSGDLYATLIMGGITSTVGSNSVGLATIINPISLIVGHFLTRSYTQVGTSVTAGKNLVDSVNTTTVIGANTTLAYPVSVDSGLWIANVRVYESGTPAIPRGEMPGFIGPLHNKPLTHLDIFAGSGDLAGKNYLVLNAYTSGQLFMEISNTWSL